jgi:hypothetical protein
MNTKAYPPHKSITHKPKSVRRNSDDDDNACESLGTTNVHFSDEYVYKYVSGDRQPISIRIDTGLYNQFKPLAKRVYGSVCRAVEIYITAFIATVENGVYFSRTSDTPIHIDKIVIERNLRSRRKLEVLEEETVTTTKKVTKRSKVDYYDGDWRSVVTDRVNEFGHAVGCRCTMCSGAKELV